MKPFVATDGIPNALEMVQLDYKSINKLEQAYGSSFYILDVKKLRDNYRKIHDAFSSRYDRFIIGYSYKTNYLPYLCRELSKLGAYAEVVSRLEYDLAIKIGEDPRKIIFNGPLKNKDDIHYALKNESIVNIDSLYEIEFVKDYALQHSLEQVKVGLRLNFDLSSDGVSPLQEGYEVSRFGICVENGNLEFVLNQLKAIKNIKIIGLHGHLSTRDREIEFYQRITQTLCNIAKEKLKDELEYIDIGGGIYGELPISFNKKVPSFDEYAAAICQIMNTEFGHFNDRPALILEPGMAMVANTFSFIVKVIEVKTIRDQRFVLVDGSVHNIKPTMHKYNLPLRIIRQKNNVKRQTNFHITGYTCMEKDYLAHEILSELPEMNDYIQFENVGAYTLVFNPPFIKERPVIIAMEDNEFFIVRKRETIKQFFNEDIYVFSE